MKNLKKAIFALLALAMVISPLTAAQVMNVTWQWNLEDPDVTAYRYQLGGENADGWTVVSGDVSSFSADSLDPYSDYTLYLQATYDGEHWSESAVSTAKAMLQHPVAVESSVTLFGYEADIRVFDDYIEISYPASVVYPADAEAFLKAVYEKYPDYLAGSTYEISEGETVLSLPFTLSEGDKNAAIEIFKSELSAYVDAYVASLSAPVAEEAPAAVSEPEPAVVAEPAPEVVAAPAEEVKAAEPTPAEEVKPAEVVSVAEEAKPEEESVSEPAPVSKPKYSNFKFSMLFAGGAEYRFDDFNSFNTSNIYQRYSVGLDFANIIPMGRHFGLGLRSDISVGVIPKDSDYSRISSVKAFFTPDNWMEDTTADIKLTATISAKGFDFYLGGGVGYSIFNPRLEGAYTDKYGHSLGDLTKYFSTAWGPTGVVGMRFYIGNVFSLGLEGDYRYLLPAEKHYGSVNLVFGFSF